MCKRGSLRVEGAANLSREVDDLNREGHKLSREGGKRSREGRRLGKEGVEGVAGMKQVVVSA